jgi:hypothetical protein
VVHGDRACPPYWQKSSTSGTTNCVEVGPEGGDVLLRDSKKPHGEWLRFSAVEWEVFLDAAKRGEFDHIASQDTVGP